MKKRPSQNGFALVAALIFMVILSLIAVGLSGTTSSEERMARNFRDRDTAFAAAEAALRDAELHLTGAWQWPYGPVSVNAFDASCTGGLCDSMITPVSLPGVDALDFFGSAAPGSNSVRIGTVTGSPTIAGVSTANQPRYLIEAVPTQLGSRNPENGPATNRVFRITAQARGRLTNTFVKLQEVYVVPSYVN